MSDLLHVDGITKEFSGVRVLDNVTLTLSTGDILGVIGENGAGKSTFMKILSGIYTPTSGKMFLQGKELSGLDPVKARRQGISMVPQEFNLVESLKVYENVFLGWEQTRGVLLDKESMIRKTRETMDRLESNVDPEAKIVDLSVAHRQMVEIAKALITDSRILILDEPTTVLNSAEIAILFNLLRKLRDEGVAIMFISHKLHEIKDLCDDVLILRDGVPVCLESTADLTEHEIARRMVGRELNQIFPERRDASTEVFLEAENLCIANVLDDVSFKIHSGEILGFSGLVGAGRTETAEAVMGLRPLDSGTLRLKGEEVRIKSARDALNYKMAYLSEDRQGKGITMNFNIPQNVTLISIRRYIRFLINKAREARAAEGFIKKFSIRAANLNNHLRFLSGGNQQKVYLSKWMDTEPQLLILDEPTRGIDVNAKVEIYRFIRSLADQGIACLVISSELEEIIGLCNRIIVMKEGRITGELAGDSMTEEEIMFYATGLKEDQAL